MDKSISNMPEISTESVFPPPPPERRAENEGARVLEILRNAGITPDELAEHIGALVPIVKNAREKKERSKRAEKLKEGYSTLQAEIAQRFDFSQLSSTIPHEIKTRAFQDFPSTPHNSSVRLYFESRKQDLKKSFLTKAALLDMEKTGMIYVWHEQAASQVVGPGGTMQAIHRPNAVIHTFDDEIVLLSVNERASAEAVTVIL